MTLPLDGVAASAQNRNSSSRCDHAALSLRTARYRRAVLSIPRAELAACLAFHSVSGIAAVFRSARLTPADVDPARVVGGHGCCADPLRMALPLHLGHSGDVGVVCSHPVAGNES